MTSVLPTAESATVCDDWESLPTDHVQQVAQQRQALLKQQQKSAAAEEKCMKDEKPTNDQGIGSMIQKPLRLLKREKPRVQRISESEKDAVKTLSELTLDERIANYDKIRERIFNGEDDKSKDNKSKRQSSSKPSPNKPETSSQSNDEIQVEPINHLTYVQMLSHDTHTVTPAPNRAPIPPAVAMDPSGMGPPMMIPPGRGLMHGAPFPPPTWMPPPDHAPLPYGHPPPPMGQGVFPGPAPSWAPPIPPPASVPMRSVPINTPVPLCAVRPVPPKSAAPPKHPQQNPAQWRTCNPHPQKWAQNRGQSGSHQQHPPPNQPRQNQRPL